MTLPLRSGALVAWLAALSGVGWARPGRTLEGAEAPPYDVPGECSGRSEWLSSVVARLPPLLQTHPLLQTLSVRVEKVTGRGDDVYAGELVSSSGADLTDSRSVRGASCDEVLDALSLIGALGLERIAARTSEPGAGDAVEADAVAAASPALGEARLGAVGFALWQGGLVPGQPIALGAGVRWAWSTPAWQPLILVGASATLPEERRLAGGGHVRYEHWSTHAVACPWRFPQSGGAWGVRPCAELDVGRSSGEGVGVDAAARRSAPWLSTGAQLRAELALWDRLELTVSLAAIAPLWRSHFFFYPGVERFDTPALGIRSSGSATVLF